MSFWAFDERTNAELEQAFSAHKDHVIISIAGFAYCIDFIRLIQYPVNHPERIRKIKRCDELKEENIKIKGIAGVRLTENSVDEGNNNNSCVNSDNNSCDEASGTTNFVNNEEQLSQILSESLQIEDVSNASN